MYLQNLHTHSHYCDGADSPEEMICTAMEKGFESIGFSGHSYMEFAKQFFRWGDKTEEYKSEITKLKEKYKGQINVFLGLEVEPCSKPDMSGYDYLIGSIHYFDFDGEYVGFDRSAAEVERIINCYFNGDGMAYAKRYYESLSKLYTYGNFDIIGHFDLITKHAETHNFFDMESKEYLNFTFEAAGALKGKIPFFEINTGAIARGYRTSPYPSIPIIKELKRLGFGAVITSDCHDRNYVDCYFNEASELLKYCGFKEKYILTESGFEAVAI